MIFELCGWISAIAFAVCAIPQAYKSYIDGHADGVSYGLLFLWLVGEISGMIYAVGLGSVPLLFNYGANCLFVGIIQYYKFFPRRSNK